MAIEFPTDLIQKLQKEFRKNAGIPTYNPSSSIISTFPSFEELISGFEPSSPKYLRCTNCNGSFLRGLASFICVYCGEEQRLVPQPINFNQTLGFRWLLDSLNLDGSEIVGPPIEENEPNRGHSKHKDEIPLSDLLNLEIQWPEESERDKDEGVTNNTSVHNPSLNIPGVDLDNFYSESKSVIESESQSDTNLQFRETESKVVLGQSDVNLFENVKLSVDKTHEQFANWEIKTIEPSKLQDSEKVNKVDNVNAFTNEKSVDRFSGWEEEFQSGNSETPHEVSSSLDPFVGSTDDLSAHMDTVFGNVDDAKNVMAKIEEDDQWQTSSAKTPNNPMIDEEDDSFGDWNEFASSSNTLAPSNSPWKQALVVDSNNLQNMEFGGFEQSDIFMGAFDDKNGSKTVDSITDESAKDEARIGEDHIKTTSSSEHDDVEMLMSQMHDLSFMLSSNLSIPKS